MSVVSMGRFEIKPTSDKRFMFNLIANNNQVICTSQTYASEDNCLKGVESVRNNCLSKIEDRTVEDDVVKNPKYEVYLDESGRYRFRLKASNGEIIAASQGYVSKKGCLKGIRSVMAHAPDATVKIVRSERSTSPSTGDPLYRRSQ